METKREIRRKILHERDLMTYKQVMDKSEAIFNRLCSLPQYKRAETVMAYMSYRNEVSTVSFLKRAFEDRKRIVLPKVEYIGTKKANTSESMLMNALEAKSANTSESMLMNTLEAKSANTSEEMLMNALEAKSSDFLEATSKNVANVGKSLNAIKVLPNISEMVMIIYEIHDLEKDIQPGFKGIPEPLGNTVDRVEPRDIDLAVIPGVVFDLAKHRIGYGGGFYDRFITSLRQDCLKAGVAFQMQLVDEIPAEDFDIPVDMVITENMSV